MRAAVVTSFDAPLELQELPIPTPGIGQVLVRLETCGLCHTDIHAARGDWPVKPTPPFIPGHEGIGVVQAVGPGVEAPTVGDRVAMPWLGDACGRCRYCVSGRETLCQTQQYTGYSMDGGYAEYALASAHYVVLVPDGLSSVDAAPLACAGVTTYKAVKVAGVRPTERVAVFGIGGLGHLALQYARIFGASVTAVDVQADKLELAGDLGADATIDASTEDPVEVIHAAGGADVALALAVNPRSFAQAYASLRPGGRLVLVALPPEGEISLPIFQTVLNGISVIGSIVGTRQDVAEVFQLHASGRTKVIAQTRTLDQVNDAFEEVLAGKVPGRLVFQY